MSDNPAREAAEREAEKRERHKPKSMVHKRWAAVHDSVKGWHPALIDCPDFARRQEIAARKEAHMALQRDDFGGFLDAAGRSLRARCKAAAPWVPFDEADPSS